MKTYNYASDTGIFYAEGIADESPLEPGVFLVPAMQQQSNHLKQHFLKLRCLRMTNGSGGPVVWSVASGLPPGSRGRGGSPGGAGAGGYGGVILIEYWSQ